MYILDRLGDYQGLHLTPRSPSTVARVCIRRAGVPPPSPSIRSNESYVSRGRV